VERQLRAPNFCFTGTTAKYAYLTALSPTYPCSVFVIATLQ
jgi:hypothetical protein